MRIVITTVQVPFITGGAEYHANNLKTALQNHGHEVEIVTMPFMDQPVELIEDHIVAARLMDIEANWAGRVDLCIGLKFPAYYMPHSNKVIWALHQYRAAYDLFDTAYSELKNDKYGNRIKRIVTNADNLYLNEAKRIYANSVNVANRMKKNNEIKATPLYHPCPDMDQFYASDYGDYILMPSRINITKRQLLAIEAMTHSASNVMLYIMGGADNTFEKTRMTDIIKEYKLQNRVHYLGLVSNEDKLKLYANARAVLFIPFDEDYGYITLEAMSASRAVITAVDSGGPLEFVENGRNGMIVKPEPEAIARAIDDFAKSPAMATHMGQEAKKHISGMNISWANVVKELTSQ